MKQKAKLLQLFFFTQWLWLLAGGLIVLILHTPVHWLAKHLKTATNGHLQINALEGNIWQGQAQLVLSDGQNVRATPGQLQWRFIWNGFELTHPLLDTPLKITYQNNQVHLTGHSIRLPAAWLKALGSPWNTIKPEGTLQVRWLPAALKQTISFTAQWQDAQSALSTVKPLGNYELHGQLIHLKQASLELRTLNGDLQLQGQGGWSIENGWQFFGEAQANPNRSNELSLLLRQIGQQENNHFRLKIQ